MPLTDQEVKAIQAECPHFVGPWGEKKIAALLSDRKELQARIAELEGALKPFAKYAKSNDADPNAKRLPDTCRLTVDPSLFLEGPTLGDCRKVLSQGGQE